MALVSTGACSFAPAFAQAADFSRAKKVYVPPTRIPRRFDSEAQEDGFSPGSNSSYSQTSGYNQAFGTPGSSAAAKGTSSKYGLVPPPPPLTPSLLPLSLLGGMGMVPAQTGMTGLSAAPAAKGSWSTTVQHNLKRASNSPKVASFIDQAQSKAQQLVKEGKVAQAQEMLKSYVKNLPRDKELQTELAQVTVLHAKQLFASQNFQAAAKNLRDALALQPGSTSAQSMLGQIFQKQGLNINSASDRLKVAGALVGQGKSSEADFEYRAALKLKPSADAHVGLGDLELRSGNKDKAGLEYQKALEVEPHSSAALRQMGLLHLSQNDLPGANSNLSRALVVDPHDSVAASNLIDLWQKQVSNNVNEVNGHLGLARAYQLSGDLQSSQSEYRKVVQIEPNNPNLPAARQSFKLALARQEAQKATDAAHSMESSGDLQGAYQKTTEAVSLSPGDTSIRIYQAQLAQKLGLNNEAHDIYSSVLSDDPKNTSASQGLNNLMNPGAVAALSAQSAGLLPGVSPPLAPSISQAASFGSAAAAAMTGATPAYTAPATQLSRSSMFAPAAYAPSTSASYASPSYASPSYSAPSYSSAAYPSNSYAAGAAAPNSFAPTASASSAYGLPAASLAAGAAAAAPSALTPSVASAAPSVAPSLTQPTGSSSAYSGQEAPPAATLPGIPQPKTAVAQSATQTSSQVNSMSGFLSSMRKFHYQQKAAIQQAEDAQAAQMRSETGSGGSPLSGAPPSVDGVNSLTSSVTVPNDAPMLNAAGSNLADVQSLLAKIGASSTPSLGAAATTGTALSATPAAPTSGLGALAQKFGFPYSARAGTTAAATAAGASTMPGATDAISQRLGNLQAQNQQLQSQLAAAQQQLNNMRPQANAQSNAVGPEAPSVMPGQNYGGGYSAPAMNAAPAMNSMPTQNFTSPQSYAVPAQNFSMAAPPLLGSSAGSSTALLALANSPAGVSALAGLPPEQQASIQQMLKGPIPTATPAANGTVRFELEGVKPSPLDIKLRVVLRNDQSIPLQIPSSAKAVIRMNGQPQREVRIMFPAKEVAPNSEMHGIIRVPGHNLSPSADVFIPNLLPITASDRDVHLTVPISYLK